MLFVHKGSDATDTLLQAACGNGCSPHHQGSGDVTLKLTTSKKEVFQHTHILSMYVHKAEKTRTWTDERLFECHVHLLVGLHCSAFNERKEEAEN